MSEDGMVEVTVKCGEDYLALFISEPTDECERGVEIPQQLWTELKRARSAVWEAEKGILHWLRKQGKLPANVAREFDFYVTDGAGE
jgi:hypothetical protein